MKAHSSFFVSIALLTAGLAVGQVDPSTLGGLAFVNAVGLSENTHFSVNNSPVGKEGFPAGGTTLFLGFPKGTSTIVAKNGEHPFKPLIQDVKGTSSPIIVAYLKVEQKDGEEIKTVSCLAVPNSLNKSGTEYRFLLVGTDAPQTVQIGNDTVTIPPYRLQPGRKGGHLVVSSEKKQLLEISPTSADNYLIVLYPGVDGKLAATSILDELVILEKPQS